MGRKKLPLDDKKTILIGKKISPNTRKLMREKNISPAKVFDKGLEVMLGKKSKGKPFKPDKNSFKRFKK